MYRIGYIDDNPTQYENYARKMKRKQMELILLEGCKTKAEFVNKIYEEQLDVVLIDFKMARTFGFNGTTLISYINDQIRDLECFILTSVDEEQIDDGLVATRNRYPKTVFDTEADNQEKLARFDEFISTIKESADVFRTRQKQKVEEYRALLQKKKENRLGVEEEDFLRLYKVLSSYGMVEKLPESMLDSKFEQSLDELLAIGNSIIKNGSK